MNKVIRRFSQILFSVLILFGLPACSFSFSDLFSGSPTGLTFERAADGTVSGSFKYPREQSKESLVFSVSPDGFAGFWLDDGPEGDMLTVDLRYQEDPRLSWHGVDLDGKGALSPEEEIMLRDLSISDLAYGLVMIPLDIACQPDGLVDPAQLAALLYPLQMRFKYQISDRAAVSQVYASISQCNYGDKVTGPGDNPSLIFMSAASPVPIVLGYFPFDAEGAIESPTGSGSGYKLAALDAKIWGNDAYALRTPGLSSFGSDPIENEWGPCSAKCRGACGADCTHTNCIFSYEDRCDKNQEGKNDGYRTAYYVYKCGIHPACIEHDACYDDCNRYYGCGTFKAAICMHAMTLVSMPVEGLLGSYLSCDSEVLVTEGPLKAKDWMRGYGPFTASQVFQYTDPQNRYEYDPMYCPLEEEPQPEEVITQPEEQESPSVDESGVSPEVEVSPEVPEVISTIPEGVYLGEIEFTEEMMAYVESAVSDVTIIVEADGTVTGSFGAQVIETPWNYGYDYQYTGYLTGTFSGSLTSNSGVIQSSENYYNTVVTDDPQATTDSFSYVRDVTITIDGEQLIGIPGVCPESPTGQMFIFRFITSKFE
jgi:hypothetical protein